MQKGRVAVTPQRRHSWTDVDGGVEDRMQRPPALDDETSGTHPIFPNFFWVGEEPEPRSTLYLTFTITTSTFEQQIPTVVA